jgi:hypothetical protein
VPRNCRAPAEADPEDYLYPGDLTIGRASEHLSHLSRDRWFESISLQRRVSNESSSAISPVGRLLLDLPDQPLAHARIGLLGLLLDQPIDLPVAIVGVVALRPAHVILVECGVRIVHFGFGDVEAEV